METPPSCGVSTSTAKEPETRPVTTPLRASDHLARRNRVRGLPYRPRRRRCSRRRIGPTTQRRLSRRPRPRIHETRPSQRPVPRRSRLPLGHNPPRHHPRDTRAEAKARLSLRVAAHLPFAHLETRRVVGRRSLRQAQPEDPLSRSWENRGDHEDVGPRSSSCVLLTPATADRRPATRRSRFPNRCNAATTRPWLLQASRSGASRAWHISRIGVVAGQTRSQAASLQAPAGLSDERGAAGPTPSPASLAPPP